MRLTFLLDENILYHAIRGVDRHDNPDPTAAELLQAIGAICHGIFVHPVIIARYQTALKKLGEHPPHSQAANDFLKQFLYNNLKRNCVYGDLPPLPCGVQLPAEDVEIVEVALISRPTVVTADSGLLTAINSHPALGLRALDAREALELARSERP